MRLARFITHDNKLMYSALGLLFFLGTYFLTNRFPVFEPQEWPLTAIDNLFPFWEWTFWVYSTELLLIFSMFFLIKDEINLNRFFYAYMTLNAVSVICFFFFPVSFPRHLYPVQDPMGLTGMSFNFFRTHLDNPTNTFPSLHVGAIYLSTLVFLQEQKGKFLPYFIWANLILISTLTTKQHYIADVLGGVILSFMVYWIFFLKVDYSK